MFRWAGIKRRSKNIVSRHGSANLSRFKPAPPSEKFVGCSHGAMRRPILASCLSADRPPGRWLQLHAIDVNDLALVRPIFRATDQVCAHRIFAHIFPFLRVTFIAAQQMIEESFLPNLCVPTNYSLWPAIVLTFRSIGPKRNPVPRGQTDGHDPA